MTKTALRDPRARSDDEGLTLEERVARLETWAAGAYPAFTSSRDPVAREFHEKKWREEIARDLGRRGR